MGTYILNLDEYESIGTHWIALSVNAEMWHVLIVEHIPKEIRKFIRSKNIIRNICRVQAFDSIICGTFALDLRLW